jgi:hypothetical protein
MSRQWITEVGAILLLPMLAVEQTRKAAEQ